MERHRQYPLGTWTQTVRVRDGKRKICWVYPYLEDGETRYEIRWSPPQGYNYQKTADDILRLPTAAFFKMSAAEAQTYLHEADRLKAKVMNRLNRKAYHDANERRRLARAYTNLCQIQRSLNTRIEDLRSITPTPSERQNVKDRVKHLSKGREKRITRQTVRTLKTLSEGDKEFGGGIDLDDKANRLPQKIVARKGSIGKGSLDDSMQVTFHTHPPRASLDERKQEIQQSVFDAETEKKLLKQVKSQKSREEIAAIKHDLNELLHRAVVSANIHQNPAQPGMSGDLGAFDARRPDPTLIVAGEYIVTVVDTGATYTPAERDARAIQYNAMRLAVVEEAKRTSNLDESRSLQELRTNAAQFRKDYIKGYTGACAKLGLQVAITKSDSITVPIIHPRNVITRDADDYRDPME